jgi:acyl carrier protein
MCAIIARVIAEEDSLSPESRVITVVQKVFEERLISQAVTADDILIDIGLTSLDIVRMVLLVETEFDLMLPTTEITPANFRSISTISRLVSRLLNAS